MAAPSFLEPLRPKPFRGDVIAAGVVVLTTLVYLLGIRFTGWAAGVHLTYSALAAGFVATLAVLAPMEREAPRAYQSILYVATIVLALRVAEAVAELLSGDGGDGELAWTLAAGAAIASFFAWSRNSAVSTLLAAVGASYAVRAFLRWAVDAGPGLQRWTLVALMAVFGLAAIAQRDRRRRHGVAFVDAVGVLVLLLGAGLLAEHFAGAWFDLGEPSLDARVEPDSIAWGWSLLLLSAGFGLIAYSSVDREPGPAYFGVGALFEFGFVAGHGSFVGWPVVLLAVALLLLVIGLRPTTPAPPAPDADAPPAPMSPLR